MSEDIMYRLKYKLVVEYNKKKGFTRTEILDANKKDPEIGACDSILFVSVVKPLNGGFSILPFSFGDFSTVCMSDQDIFKTWVMMAHNLLHRRGLTKWQKSLAQAVHDEMCNFITKNRDDN